MGVAEDQAYSWPACSTCGNSRLVALDDSDRWAGSAVFFCTVQKRLDFLHRAKKLGSGDFLYSTKKRLGSGGFLYNAKKMAGQWRFFVQCKKQAG